jgi:DNA polymerase|nr:uracil-DNA glycosylase [Kofleriaceae bacterium]
MDSTPVGGGGSDLAELAALVGQLRARLGRYAAAGSWAAPGEASRRPVRALADDFDDAPAHPVVEIIEPPAPSAGSLRRSLAQIRADVGDCTRCKLHETRTSIVFGVGDPGAPLMFVGEAPGEQEDRTGEPFVGRAGELLDRMIEAMGWTRDTVYITNTLHCRPPNNRTPQADELAACAPFLTAKLQSIAPRIIVALGRPAANQLLGRDAPISALRGKFHERHGARVMPTFHPAYLLREPDRKRDTWDDLKLVIAELQRLGVSPPKPPRV